MSTIIKVGKCCLSPMDVKGDETTEHHAGAHRITFHSYVSRWIRDVEKSVGPGLGRPGPQSWPSSSTLA